MFFLSLFCRGPVIWRTAPMTCTRSQRMPIPRILMVSLLVCLCLLLPPPSSVCSRMVRDFLLHRSCSPGSLLPPPPPSSRTCHSIGKGFDLKNSCLPFHFMTVNIYIFYKSVIRNYPSCTSSLQQAAPLAQHFVMDLFGKSSSSEAGPGRF